MNHPPGSYVPLEAAGGLGQGFSYHGTTAFGSSYWQTREAEKPVVSAGFPGRDRCVMKKHQENQNKTKKTKVVSVKYKMLYVSTAVLDILRKTGFLLDTCIYLDTC